jgi:phenylalanyl-tRNA synthetase beta chain
MRAVQTLENPLSESQSILRPTLLVSLLDAAAHNAARGVARLALFESGTVFRADAGEHHGLAALLTSDFFAAKALLEAVLEAVGVASGVQRADDPFLHPGRAASVLAGDRRIGFVGELHPLVAQAWELPQLAVWAVDLGRVAALAPEVRAFQPFASFPPVREDLAVVVGDGVEAAEVLRAVRAAAGGELAAAETFDVYRGAQVGEGRVSLAIHLEFRAADRTLTDEEVAAIRERIVAGLGEIGGTIRG